MANSGELSLHTRDSLAALSHTELLDTALALAVHCHALEETLTALTGGAARIYSLPDEVLSPVLLLLPFVSRLRACVVCRRFKRLLSPALRAELPLLTPPRVLLSGRGLAAGSTLNSPDGHFRLIYQGDANLVLYYYRITGEAEHDEHPVPVWALQTVHVPYNRYQPGGLHLSPTGVVCVCDVYGRRYWETPAQAPGLYRLVVRNEGDFVVLDENDAIVWAAVTADRPRDA